MAVLSQCHIVLMPNQLTAGQHISLLIVNVLYVCLLETVAQLYTLILCVCARWASVAEREDTRQGYGSRR